MLYPRLPANNFQSRFTPFSMLMVLELFFLFGAASAVADEMSSTYYCNSELKWADWPPREDRSSAELKRVAVFGRHGARVPVARAYAEKCWVGDVARFICPTRTFLGYTNSPSSGASPGFTRIRGKHGIIPGNGCIAGQLVDSGVQMHLNNGEQIAHFYKEALGLEDIPNSEHIMIRSTEVPRVIQSATAFMIGMFPTLNVSSSPLNMVIPDEAADPMVPKPSVCPLLKDQLNTFYNSALAKNMVARTRAQRAYLGRITGRSSYFSTQNPPDMHNLYSDFLDCLTAHYCPTVPSDDKTVPRELQLGSRLLADVFTNATFWLSGSYGTSPELMKLAYGPMINDFLDDLQVTCRKFSLYMGHDTGPVTLIMDALGLTWVDTGNRCSNYWPPFGAMLVMESYSDDQVRWIYNGRVASMDAITDCKTKPTCSFKLMRTHLASFVPSRQECQPEHRRRTRLRV